MRWCLVAVLGGIAVTAPLHAQAPVTVLGVVLTETGRPLEGALVELGPRPTARRVETDSAGRFRFDRVARGRQLLRVLQIGYQAEERELEIGESVVELTVVMRRLPFALDTLRVTAQETRVFGTVISREPFQPVAGANVSLMGTRHRAVTAASGQFEFRPLREGAYVVFAGAAGLLSRFITLFVPADSAVEVAAVLDSQSAPGARRRAQMMAEFSQRSRWLGANSALIPRQELAGHERQGVADALQYSVSFLKKGLYLDPDFSCVYENGLPKPGAHPNLYMAGEIEAVEVYTARGEYTNTLASRWPRGFPCGNPERAARAARSGRDVVTAIVIWTRR
jgi:hypothetical protein